MAAGNGFMGRALFVDLSSKRVSDEPIPEAVYREYLGGYGLAVRVLYERMKPGTGPLGPDNILCFSAGPLTGTGTISSSRFSVAAKSPLTGTWGDSNCGGAFGPQLKRAGYDAVFLTGRSDKPVYLLLEDTGAVLKDAGHLWGKDAYETERLIKADSPPGVEVVTIGQSGEKRSLISCIITDGGRAAGRSGLGAVMGSKNLKAIAARGGQKVAVADRDELVRQNRRIGEAIRDPDAVTARLFGKYGTSASTVAFVKMQRAPIGNWKGTTQDFPKEEAAKLSGDALIEYEDAKYGCTGCPIKCGGRVEQKTGPYALKKHSHKPEYETLVAFGALCLNSNLESVILANDICNRYGLDTISAGATVAFAMECYEAGLIDKEDTSVDLRRGDPDSVVAVLRLIAERKGIGDILADGVRAAALKIGKGSEMLAMHVGGQEMPMHDPRFAPGYGATYVVDPTPGRHTAGGGAFEDVGIRSTMVAVPKVDDKYDFARKGETHVPLSNLNQVITCAGLCLFPTWSMKGYPIVELLNAATGWDLSLDALLKIGERIQMLRHCFNIREGFTPGDFRLPARVRGEPPLDSGPLQGIRIDDEAMARSCLRAMGVDELTGKPLPEKVKELGLEDLIGL